MPRTHFHGPVARCAFGLALSIGLTAAAAETVATDLEAGLARGEALAAAGEVARAQELFERLAAAHPDRPEPLNDLAVLAARAGDLPRARALLERALATQPSFRAVHDNLANIYAAQAGEAYRKALPLTADGARSPELVMLTRIEPPAMPAVTTATEPSAADAPSAGGPSDDPTDVRAREAFAAVARWAEAWSAQDLDGYFAAYAPDFEPGDGSSHAEWVEQRQIRIVAPKRIEVVLSQRHLVIEPGGERASMSFRQSYRSDRFNGDSWKTLELVVDGGRWSIVGERSGR